MIRAAVIGLGIIGKLHAELTLLNGNLVAVCDVDESCLNLYPGVKQYKNYVRMLDEVKPDVVHICTPHYLHAEMVLASLKRNVNVLCEKPVCINSDELDEIFDENAHDIDLIQLENEILAKEVYGIYPL